jgi:hypothetical protein
MVQCLHFNYKLIKIRSGLCPARGWAPRRPLTQ